jgi:hypothetical protein
MLKENSNPLATQPLGHALVRTQNDTTTMNAQTAAKLKLT